jgi:hypothetical protein
VEYTKLNIFSKEKLGEIGVPLIFLSNYYQSFDRIIDFAAKTR